VLGWRGSSDLALGHDLGWLNGKLHVKIHAELFTAMPSAALYDFFLRYFDFYTRGVPGRVLTVNTYTGLHGGLQGGCRAGDLNRRIFRAGLVIRA
jgi:hypothetical protein